MGFLILVTSLICEDLDLAETLRDISRLWATTLVMEDFFNFGGGVASGDGGSWCLRQSLPLRIRCHEDILIFAGTAICLFFQGM